MSGRLLLAILVALAVAVSAAPAEVQVGDDPAAEVDQAVVAEALETTLTETKVRTEHEVPALRPRDASPPPVPPPEP